jgi:hypothetical protein
LSLRDEHLQQALKHAPDSDLAPSELVRKNVLNYAKHSKQTSQYQFLASPFSLSAKALSRMRKSHGHWLAGLLPNIKNWQWAGMSSVAVALLAALMLREQLPEEPIWRESKVREVAQNSAPAPEIALKEERADMAATPASIQEEAPARTTGAQTKAKASATTPELADKDNVVVAAAAEVAAPLQVPAEQALAKQDNGVVAENTAKTEARGVASAPASDAVASAEQTIASVEKSEAEKPAAAAKKSLTLVDAVALGVAKANQDIHAGVLRILVADWPADKSLVDESTGYRVELSADLVPAELDAYNQTMRDWFKMQH